MRTTLQKMDFSSGEITEEMMAGRLIDPTYDWAFKKLFGIEKFLVSLLNCILRRPDDNRIVTITYNEQEHQSLHEEGRICRFDIVCETAKGESFHIEVQKHDEPYFADRLLYYSALYINRKGKSGKWNYQYAPHYTIAICGFTFEHEAENHDKYSYYYQMREEDSARDVLTNSINVILVELPKFENVSSECNTLLKKWLFLLRNMHELTQEEVENMFDDEILKEFIDKAAFEKLSEDEKIMYLKSCYDEGARRCHLRKEREEGLAEGIEKGLAEGEKIGMEKGREEERRLMARNLKINGVDIELIARCTGLSEEEVKNL